MLGKATPKTQDQRSKMMEKTGKDHFLFFAAPRLTVVQTATADVPALKWAFNDVDADLQAGMIGQLVANKGYTEESARAFLTETGVFFIEADLEIANINPA